MSVARPKIRMYSAQDRPGLTLLLQKVWACSESEWESHLPASDSITFLAFHNERLVAMMTRFERTFHPHTTTLEFGIDPETDTNLRRLLEEILFDQIVQEMPKDRISRTQLLETQTQEIEFVQRKRFLEMRRTWMPNVSVSSLPVIFFEDDLRLALERGFSIHGLNEFQDDPEFMLRLAEANRDHYLSTHSINPPLTVNLSEWYDLAFAEDWLPEA